MEFLKYGIAGGNVRGRYNGPSSQRCAWYVCIVCYQTASCYTDGIYFSLKSGVWNNDDFTAVAVLLPGSLCLIHFSHFECGFFVFFCCAVSPVWRFSSMFVWYGNPICNLMQWVFPLFNMKADCGYSCPRIPLTSSWIESIKYAWWTTFFICIYCIVFCSTAF